MMLVQKLFDELVSFNVIMDHGSVTKAAKVLSLHRSSLVRHIEKLESLLKIQLFDRTNKGYIANANAEALYNKTANFINQYNNIIADIQALDSKKEKQETIRLCFPLTTAVYFTQHILPTLCKKLPQVNIDVATYTSGQVLDNPGFMSSYFEQFDIIALDNDLTTYIDEDLWVHGAKFTETCVLLASEAYLKENPIQSLEDLKRVNFLGFCNQLKKEGIELFLRKQINRSIVRKEEKIEVSLHSQYSFDNTYLQLQLAHNSEGVAYLPKVFGEIIFNNKGLVRVLPDYEGVDVTILFLKNAKTIKKKQHANTLVQVIKSVHDLEYILTAVNGINTV